MCRRADVSKYRRMKKNDQIFMKCALDLARKGKGHVEPNPMVGCVIVKSGKIIAQGYHKKFGGPHAEIEALKKINFKAKKATMYVTLEPCCHFGKTPPCVDAVIKSGVKRVVIGMKDPNPVVNGRSIRKLKGAGIRVKVLGFRQRARPYVIVKVAQSLDGMIAARKGVRTQITGRQALAYVQKLRASVDAILVGANTIRVDDPQLNVRDRKKKQPLRIVLSKSGKVDRKSRIFRTRGGRVVVLSVETRLIASLQDITKQIYRLGVRRLLVEGGAQVFAQFLKSNLVNEWHVITAPVRIGSNGVSVFGSSVVCHPSSVERIKKKGFVVKEKKMLGKDELIVFKKNGGRRHVETSARRHV